MTTPKLKNHPNIRESIETGYRVMEQLKERRQPLSDDLLLEYLAFGSNRLKNLLAKKEPTDDDVLDFYELRSTFQDAIDALGLLERCSYPVPRDIMARVCRCSRSSLSNYNKQVLDKVKQICNAEIKKADCEDLLRSGLL